MYLGSWVWRKSLKGLMCGPFSSITTRSPACARRSAGAAAPNPVPITRTSVCTTDMASSSGPVPVARQGRRQEALRVGIGDGCDTAEAVRTLEVDQRASAGVVVNPGVITRLHHENRAAIETLDRGVRGETCLHDGHTVGRAQAIERGVAGPGGGSPAQVGDEKAAVRGEPRTGA